MIWLQYIIQQKVLCIPGTVLTHIVHAVVDVQAGDGGDLPAVMTPGHWPGRTTRRKPSKTFSTKTNFKLPLVSCSALTVHWGTILCTLDTGRSRSWTDFLFCWSWGQCPLCLGRDEIVTLSQQNLDIFCIILRKLGEETRGNVGECFSEHAKMISYCLKSTNIKKVKFEKWHWLVQLHEKLFHEEFIVMTSTIGWSFRGRTLNFERISLSDSFKISPWTLLLLLDKVKTRGAYRQRSVSNIGESLGSFITSSTPLCWAVTQLLF